MEDLDKARICSRHFQESDFVRDIRNELLNIPQRKLLSSSAIPSRNLPTEVTKVDLTHVGVKFYIHHDFYDFLKSF